MKNKNGFIIIMFLLCESVYSGQLTRYVGDVNFAWNNKTQKMTVTRGCIVPNTKGYYVYKTDINDSETAYLLRDSKTLEYKFFIYNKLNSKYSNNNNLETGLINYTVKGIYVSGNDLYTLESDEMGNLILNQRLYDGKVVLTRKLNLITNDLVNVLIVDIEAEVLIIHFLLQNYFVIYSLKSDEIIFRENGILFYKISNETKMLHYADKNRIFTISYRDNMKRRIIDTFLDSKERVVELVKFDDEYILVSEKKKIDLFKKFVFGIDDCVNYYYHCKLSGNKLEKKEFLLKNKTLLN